MWIYGDFVSWFVDGLESDCCCSGKDYIFLMIDYGLLIVDSQLMLCYDYTAIVVSAFVEWYR